VTLAVIRHVPLSSGDIKEDSIMEKREEDLMKEPLGGTRTDFSKRTRQGEFFSRLGFAK
jgi:hypothetical protein